MHSNTDLAVSQVCTHAVLYGLNHRCCKLEYPRTGPKPDLLLTASTSQNSDFAVLTERAATRTLQLTLKAKINLLLTSIYFSKASKQPFMHVFRYQVIFDVYGVPDLIYFIRASTSGVDLLQSRSLYLAGYHIWQGIWQGARYGQLLQLPCNPVPKNSPSLYFHQ